MQMEALTPALIEVQLSIPRHNARWGTIKKGIMWLMQNNLWFEKAPVSREERTMSQRWSLRSCGQCVSTFGASGTSGRIMHGWSLSHGHNFLMDHIPLVAAPRKPRQSA